MELIEARRAFHAANQTAAALAEVVDEMAGQVTTTMEDTETVAVTEEITTPAAKKTATKKTFSPVQTPALSNPMPIDAK